MTNCIICGRPTVDDKCAVCGEDLDDLVKSLKEEYGENWDE